MSPAPSFWAEFPSLFLLFLFRVCLTYPIPSCCPVHFKLSADKPGICISSSHSTSNPKRTQVRSSGSESGVAQWWEMRGEREREIPTWATSMLESQLRGRTAVRSLEPSKVEMIPFWSTLRIMVASTKYMSPFLSTAIPEWGKQHKCVSWQGTGLVGWWWWWGCPTTHYLLGWGTWLDSTLKSHLRWHPFSRALCWDLANSWGVGYFTIQVKKEPWAANEPRLWMNEWGDHFASALF